ncbi:MAG: zinc-dependent metalloprotease [Bacteroidota bacterium]
MNYRFSLFFCFALITISNLFAQQHTHDRGCGVTESHPWMDAYLAGEIATPRSLTPLALPVRYIFVGRSDGTGYAVLDDLLEAHCLANEDFGPSNLSFYIESMDTINNTTYFNNGSGNQMMGFNNQSGVINIYLIGNAEGICGYYSPFRDAIVMRNDCMSSTDHTLSHEIGHYLALRHTFFGWEGEGGPNNDPSYLPTDENAPSFINGQAVERADSSNCSFAADGFCDTPPDYASFSWSCNFEGIYPDSLLDPDGIKFGMRTGNIMSYTSNACTDSFSTQQMTAMEVNANSRVSLHTGETFTDFVPGVTDLIAPDDGESLPANDFALLEWEAVDDADFYIVQINFTSNFNGAVLRQWVVYDDTSLAITDGLINNRFYFWRVRAVNKHFPCTDNASSVRQFRNGNVSNVNDPILDAAITVFPNPAIAGAQSIQIQGEGLPYSGLFSYELTDATGRVLRASSPVPVSGSSLRQEIQVDQLTTGVYFLRLRLDGRLLTRRVVLL